MREQFMHLTSQEVKDSMNPVTPEYSYTKEISDSLQQTVYGQEEACDAVARRVAMFDAGLGNPERPLGVEFFAGPTGVGKTEMSRALANHMFGSPDSEQLKIIDCSEFSERHTVARLLGSPPGYVGHGDPPLITNDLLMNRNILVFDEIEKASPQFHKLLLSVMEDARMTVTTKGGQEELVFNQSLIIMTSNVGAHEVDEANNGKGTIGFAQKTEPEHTDIKQISTKALKEVFAPEFINRIDDIVVFKNLEPEHYERIFYKFLDEINADLSRYDPHAPFIAATQEFRQYIIDRIDTKYGARDMRRQIDRELLEGLADLFMGLDMRGRPVVADREGDTTCFYTIDAPELPPLDDLNYEVIGSEVEFIPEEDAFYGQPHEEEPPQFEDKEADVTDPPKTPRDKTPSAEVAIPPNKTVDVSIRVKENGKAIDSVSVYDLPLFPYVE